MSEKPKNKYVLVATINYVLLLLFVFLINHLATELPQKATFKTIKQFMNASNFCHKAIANI